MGSEHDAVRLLLFGLDRNETHARPLGRFTDRFCIGGVVLLPLDERLDVGWRDQAHMMALLSDFARQVMRAGAGFHRDDAPSLRCSWNACFAMSKPIVVAYSLDVSFGGSSTRHLGTQMQSGGVHPIARPSVWPCYREGRLRGMKSGSAGRAECRLWVQKGDDHRDAPQRARQRRFRPFGGTSKRGVPQIAVIRRCWADRPDQQPVGGPYQLV